MTIGIILLVLNVTFGILNFMAYSTTGNTMSLFVTGMNTSAVIVLILALLK